MYVCLCVGVTNQMVADVVAGGATTSKQVAAACGAGGECGRCRRTVRAIIDARRGDAAPAPADPAR
jgi:bacterioferritin-associated ferredoxin